MQKKCAIEKLSVRFELEAKSLSQKLKGVKVPQKIPDTKHLFLITTFVVIIIYIITILKKTNNFTNHSFRTFRTITVTLWSDIV